MPSAEISGGGIAGLTTAIVLSRRGWTVTVHERAAELRAGGNGLTMFENGLRVLHALDLHPNIEDLGWDIEKYDILDNNGEEIARYDPKGAGNSRVFLYQRQQLIDLLAAAARKAGAEIKLSSSVKAATVDGELYLEDGTVRTADLIVGADGIRSVIRQAICDEVELELMPRGAIRLLVPSEPEMYPDGGAATCVEYMHPDGRRAATFPCSETLTYMALASSTDDAAGSRLPLDTESWSESFPMLRQFFERAGSLGHYDRYLTCVAPRWTSGRCAIIGDAAHGMTPALGQGAGCALMTV